MATTNVQPRRTGFTTDQIVLVGSAALALIAFFLPWVNAEGGNPSGFTIASIATSLQAIGISNLGIAPLLYSVPLLALVALALAFVRRPAAGPSVAAAGLLLFAVLVIFLAIVTRAPTILDAVSKGGTPLPFFGVGLWIGLLAAIGVSIGGLFAASRFLAPGSALTTRRIVTAGMLGAIAITLGVTQLGFIPVPNTINTRGTIMHIPAIIGAALEGPVVGIVAGGIFGLFSMLNDTTGLFTNPIISVFPRLMIGLMAWVAYRSLVKINRDLAAVVAGVVGTLTNTILVVGLLIGFGLIPAAAALGLIPQAIFEVIIAAVLTPIVVRGVGVTRSGRTVADERGPREKSYF